MLGIIFSFSLIFHSDYISVPIMYSVPIEQENWHVEQTTNMNDWYRAEPNIDFTIVRYDTNDDCDIEVHSTNTTTFYRVAQGQ